MKFDTMLTLFTKHIISEQWVVKMLGCFKRFWYYLCVKTKKIALEKELFYLANAFLCLFKSVSLQSLVWDILQIVYNLWFTRIAICVVSHPWSFLVHNRSRIFDIFSTFNHCTLKSVHWIHSAGHTRKVSLQL